MVTRGNVNTGRITRYRSYEAATEEKGGGLRGAARLMSGTKPRGLCPAAVPNPDGRGRSKAAPRGWGGQWGGLTCAKCRLQETQVWVQRLGSMTRF